MTIKNEFPALYKGLNQIPTDGLERLQQKLNDGVPVAVWGGYYGTDPDDYSRIYWPMIEALPAEAYKNVTEMQDDRSLGNGMTKYWQDVLGNFDSDLGFYNDGHSVTYSGDLSLAQRDGVTKMVEYILEERKG